MNKKWLINLKEIWKLQDIDNNYILNRNQLKISINLFTIVYSISWSFTF